MLYVISAASGTGKSTITKRLIAGFPRCVLSISYTTRAPRQGEKNGWEYFFIGVRKFRQMIKQRAFLEYAEVHGNYYGTSLKQVKKNQHNGLDVFLDIDVQGAAQLRRKMKRAVFVFILPPAFDDLRDRLLRRGTEDGHALQVRLKNALREIRASKAYDYWIVNEKVDESAAELKAIVLANRLRKERAYQRLRERSLPIVRMLKV